MLTKEIMTAKIAEVINLFTVSDNKIFVPQGTINSFYVDLI